MENTTQELTVVANNLPEPKLQGLLNSYEDSFRKAKEVVQKAKGILVTSEDQLEEMKQARAVRLELKDIRVHVENIRVELKEQSLREGKAIDGMANIIKAIIVPVEEYLEKQEKYAEEQKKIRDEQKYQNRINLLTPWVKDITAYDVRNLSEETFTNVLESSKKAFEAIKEAEKRAEDDRIAKIKAQEAENDRIRKENEKLKEQNRIKNEKLRIAREETERAEKKLRDEKEAQEKKIREEQIAKEATEKAEAEAKKQQLLAPDKQKIMDIWYKIENIDLPEVSSNEAKIALGEIRRQLSDVAAFVQQKAKSL